MAFSVKQIATASATFAIFSKYFLALPIWKTLISAFLLLQLINQFWAIILYPKLFDPLRHLPTPAGGSFWSGQFRTILKLPTGEPHEIWAREVPNDGIIYYRTLFNVGRVFVVSPKALADVLVTKSYDFIKPPQIQKSIGRILGIGILFAEGEEHKAQRKNLNPAFSYRHLKDLYPVFWSKSHEMIAQMDKNLAEASASASVADGSKNAAANIDPEKAAVPEPNVVNAADWASRATLDIIGVAGLDQSFRAIQEPTNKLFQTYQAIFKPNRQARILGIIAQFIPFWLLRSLPVKRNTQLNDAMNFLRRTCMNIIQEKRSKMDSSASSTKESDSEHEASSNTTKPDTDILSVALRSRFFTDSNLVDQLMTFLAAGHETTASSMQWAILSLAQHPDIQTRLRAELHAAIRSNDLPSPRTPSSTATATQIDALPYLNAVCAEVLRFHPPVPLTLRIAARDTSILSTFIPKGTTILIVPRATNRDTALWGPDAGVFNPERWIKNPGSGGAESNYAQLTFLHGPRSCIGQGFAKAEFACLLAAWVAAFEFELKDPEAKIEIAGGVTSRPKGGVVVRVRAVDA